jgi:hypothetical protein
MRKGNGKRVTHVEVLIGGLAEMNMEVRSNENDGPNPKVRRGVLKGAF